MSRIIYPAQAVFVGNSPATGQQTNIKQLYRVKQTSNDFSVNRTDVNAFGQYESLDQVILNPPEVSFNVEYEVTNVANEAAIGLYVSGDKSVVTNLINGTDLIRNYYVRIVPHGQAAVGYTGTDGGVVGIGNAALASYSTKGALGQFPTASFSTKGLNVKYDITSSGIDSPAVNPINGQPVSYTVTIPTAISGVAGQVSALRPGDITVDLNSYNFGISGMSIQSYDLKVDFKLTPVQGLGDRYPSDYELEFPINCSMSIDGSLQIPGSGNLADVMCADQSYDLSVTLRDHTCNGALGNVKAKYTLKGAKIKSQGDTSSVGPVRSTKLEFECPIAGPNVTARGLFLSGSLV